MNHWLDGLNEEQKTAASHVEGPLLILAGAGSGKTTVLVSRTGHLIEQGHAQANEFLVLTFTNKAARELSYRVAAKLGDQARGLWTGTFHSFGLQLLRKNAKLAGLPKSFGIIDSSDSAGIVQELLKDIHFAGKSAFKVETLLSIMSDWRSRGQLKAKTDDEYDVMAEALLPKYLSRLDALGVVDFHGLLIKPLELFEQYPEVFSHLKNRFKFLMVDEFQDTNDLQFRLVKKLSEDSENIAVVGDDDQSIYGWRGAVVQNILDFPRIYSDCKVVSLERNYRSTPAILSVANSVIAKNEYRHSKVLKSDPQAVRGDKPELFVYENEDEESEGVITQIKYFQDKGFNLKDMAILYRSNGQGGLLEGVLRQNQVQYNVTGSSSLFDRKETKDMIAFLRCSLRPNEVALRRVINLPHRGIGETTIQKLHNYAEEQQTSFYQALKQSSHLELTDSSRAGIQQFMEIIHHLPEQILQQVEGFSVGDALVKWAKSIGYFDHLRKIHKNDDALNHRWMTIEILGRILDRFIEKGGRDKKTLRDFVDAMELRDVADDDSDKTDKVQLLTFHACKGLEWPVVLMIGLEEDLIPHRTLGSDTSEERRLFYVGLTRAKQHLVMTRVGQRKRYGRPAPSSPSRFLLEIPQNLYKEYANGSRPVSESRKKAMLGDLMAKLENQMENQKVDLS